MSRHTTRALFCLSVALVVAGGISPATATLYGTIPAGDDSLLVRIDPGSGAATAIGPTGFPAIVGLAVRAGDGALFGSSGLLLPDNRGTVIAVDPASGGGTEIGPLPMQTNGPLRALAFTPAGVLLALCNRFTLLADIADSLCVVDPGNGTVTSALRLQHPGTSTLRGVEGLTVGPGGVVYAATGGLYPGEPRLFSIEVATGVATLVGVVRDIHGTTLATGISALEFDGSVLWAATDDGRILRLEPATAIYEVVGGIGLEGSVQALAFRLEPPSPTPTPGPPTATPTATSGPCSAPSQANPCIPGGAGGNDCLIEWALAGRLELRRGLPRPRVICHEGDPTCDIDPDLDNGTCVFRAHLCANNSDPRLPGCTAVDLATIEVRRPNPARLRDAIDAAHLATIESAVTSGLGVPIVRAGTIVAPGVSNSQRDRCSAAADLAVPLRRRRSGRATAASRTIVVRATDSLRARDTDALRLVCRPSTCGNGVVEPHEECDDGNRTDGDGCNRGCRIESVPFTPTAVATATASTTATVVFTPTPSGPTATATDTGTPTPTPTPGPPTNTPTATSAGGGVCGDGLLTAGESCASCPTDCTVLPCTLPSPVPTVTFRVNWAPPFGVDASSTTVLVAYRSNLISLPGSGSAPAARVTNRPPNAIVAVNDLDYALRVVITRSGAISPGRLFQVNFDRCSGVPAPTPADLACTVEGCASSFGDVEGCACEVVSP